MRTRINKTSNLILSIICFVIGLALIGGGSYLVATGTSVSTGGAMIALGCLIVIMFAVALYLILNFEKLKIRAEEDAIRQDEEMRIKLRELQDKALFASAAKDSEAGTDTASSADNAESADSTDGASAADNADTATADNTTTTDGADTADDTSSTADSKQ